MAAPQVTLEPLEAPLAANFPPVKRLLPNASSAGEDDEVPSPARAVWGHTSPVPATDCDAAIVAIPQTSVYKKRIKSNKNSSATSLLVSPHTGSTIRPRRCRSRQGNRTLARVRYVCRSFNFFGANADLMEWACETRATMVTTGPRSSRLLPVIFRRGELVDGL